MVLSWPEVVFGWPAAIAALMMLIAGTAIRRWALAAAGALVALPFLFYLFGTPLFRYWAPVIVMVNLASVLAVAKDRRWLAAAALVPFAGTLLVLGGLVLARRG
jgi:hypothetical protein